MRREAGTAGASVKPAALIARFAKAFVVVCGTAHPISACGGSADDGPNRAAPADVPAQGENLDVSRGPADDTGTLPAAMSGSSVACPNAAQQLSPCTQDCREPCGFQRSGESTCSCVDGAYVACSCPRPPEYLGAVYAPYCDTPDGAAEPLGGAPCASEWEQCVGTDPVTGAVPRGCACLVNPASSRLEWFCGSRHHWFLLEPGAVSPLCATAPDDPRCPPPDPSCTRELSRSGSACTRDCIIPCGIDGTGTKTCECVGGAYAACSCLMPQ